MQYTISDDKGVKHPAAANMHEAKPWTDAAVVRAVRGGGQERDAALHWWFADESLHRWVDNYTVQHGGTTADGEDLYHDTFITFDRLLRNDKYRGEASLRTFFCSIAKWQWLNRQRKSGRTVTMHNPEILEIAGFSYDDMYSRERQTVCERMLTALGDRCKKLLTLYQLNYSMKEIASEMGYASDQVAMNQCSECRKKLKHYIETNDELKDFLNL